MQEYMVLLGRCLLFYFLITALLRLMGKREVGELSVFDIVVYFVMSELLAISISNPNESVWKTILPIVTLTLLQIVLSWIMLKITWIRNLFDGKPVILVAHGKLNIAQMKRQRYTVDDLLSQLRSAGTMDLQEVKYAVLENSGELTVIRSDASIGYPEPLISDGKVQRDVLKAIGHDEKWLQSQLRDQGYADYREIFLCLYYEDGLHIVAR